MQEIKTAKCSSFSQPSGFVEILNSIEDGNNLNIIDGYHNKRIAGNQQWQIGGSHPKIGFGTSQKDDL